MINDPNHPFKPPSETHPAYWCLVGCQEYAQLLCEDFLIGPIRPEIGCCKLSRARWVKKQVK